MFNIYAFLKPYVHCDQHNGTSTLLIPPENVVQSTGPPALSDISSIMSTTSKSMIQYQCPFRLGHVGLTDLRSMQVRLHNSLSSMAAFLTSTASSGVPRIGYLLGKAVKWT